MARLENRLNGYRSNAVQGKSKKAMTGNMMSLTRAAVPTGEEEQRHYES